MLLQEVFPTSDLNLVRSMTNICDTYMEQYHNPENMKNALLSDIRSQIEVFCSNSIFNRVWNSYMTLCVDFLQCICFFSCVWSMGASLDTNSRVKFNLLFRALMEYRFPKKVAHALNMPVEICPSPNKPYLNVIPKEGLVFDYNYILPLKGKGQWKLWSEYIDDEPAIPPDMPFSEIIVPTVDTIRNHILMSRLLEHNKPLMIVGKTGTGKSSYTMVR